MRFNISSVIKCLLFFLLFTAYALNQTVYITKTGKKYHSENCSSLSSSKKSIELSEALDKGYTPCKNCKPDLNLKSDTKTNLVPENNSQVKNQSDVTKQQCEAITKSGTRCKRTTQAGSKYCWQHQK